MSNRDPTQNLNVHPGDIVSVPIDQQLYIYVDGAVKTPGGSSSSPAARSRSVRRSPRRAERPSGRTSSRFRS